MSSRYQETRHSVNYSDRDFWEKINQDQPGGNNLEAPSEKFGRYVFNRDVMQKMLPPEITENLIRASQGIEKIKPKYADTIAVAM